ncbi:MAG TPA: nucleotidyltransferase domain-containing protein [Dissulfurispiraceae bacterium]|nr:nucleotidyltransferase domain-containing protein [Dissulfurispiraceae bacterium]
MAKTRLEIIDSLAHAKPEMEKRFGVRRMALFGSYARGDFSPGSDVDVLVDVDASIGLEFVTLADAIEHAVGIKADVVSRRAIRPKLLALIEQESIYV